MLVRMVINLTVRVSVDNVDKLGVRGVQPVENVSSFKHGSSWIQSWAEIRQNHSYSAEFILWKGQNLGVADWNLTLSHGRGHLYFEVCMRGKSPIIPFPRTFEEPHCFCTQTDWGDINRRTVQRCAGDKRASSRRLTEVDIEERDPRTSRPVLIPLPLCSHTCCDGNGSDFLSVFFPPVGGSDIRPHLTCDSSDLPFEKGPNETCHVSPEADADEVEVLHFAPLFLWVEIGINQCSRLLGIKKKKKYFPNKQVMESVYTSSIDSHECILKSFNLRNWVLPSKSFLFSVG